MSPSHALAADHSARDVCFVTDVDAPESAVAAVVIDLDSGVVAVFVVVIEDRDLASKFGEADGGGTTDASCTTGNDASLV